MSFKASVSVLIFFLDDISTDIIEVLKFSTIVMCVGFLGGSDSKESTCNPGDPGSVPGLGRSPGEGNGYPLQNSMDSRSLRAIVHGFAESWI